MAIETTVEMARPKNMYYLPGLAAARADADLTFRELSEASGVVLSALHYLEHERRPARATTVAKLADALGIEPQELTGGEEVKLPRPRSSGRISAFSAPPVRQEERPETGEYDDIFRFAHRLAEKEGISFDDALIRLIRARQRLEE